ncbi:glycosyltransferase [Salipaludibacillus sp. HK11]|uniref:glycosyltransferase n=1 Tax=Salipaludibacillus sp. HK11 TaxID=3394320 RepID=UPI0039FCC0FF
MMKKKILFMLINMNIGGTEKSLLNMIAELPEEQFEITFLMLEEYGGFLDQIPSRVKVEYLTGYDEIKPSINNPPRVTSISLFKKRKFTKAISFSGYYLMAKLLNNKDIFFNYLTKKHYFSKDHYDIAIAYAGPMDFISYFVLNKIKANKKIQWIHFDVTEIGFSKPFAIKNYNKFDKVFIVSEEAKRKLISLVPSIEEKTTVLLNVVSPIVINQLCKEGKGFNDDFDGKRILTVGRLTTEKGLDLAIKAFKNLIKDGYNVKWYCVGEGNQRIYLEKLIEEYDLQEKFILLGSETNPYTYMDQCDIYVQPSRHEGYCITLTEARYLNKPIITTNFTPAKEQIITGKTGLIVDIDENEIYKAIKTLFEDQELARSFTTNLKKEDNDSKLELKKSFEI